MQVDEKRINYSIIQTIPTKKGLLGPTKDLDRELETKKFDVTTISHTDFDDMAFQSIA